MNIIISVYSKEAFLEYQLPSVNNADHAIILRSDFFHLGQNQSLYLEVMDHAWSFKKHASYSIRKNGEDYEGQPLKDQDVLNLFISGEKEIVLIVKYVKSVFHAYHKFQLAGVSQITIGEQADNDISYDYMKLVSRRHAAIVRDGAGFKIINNSLNGTYVNSYRIEKERLLSPGACIDIMGLRMIYLGSCLAVDVTGSRAKINTARLKPVPKQRETAKRRETDLQSGGKTVYHRSPRPFQELAQGEIEIEMPPGKSEDRLQPLMLTVGPSLTMALPMIAGCMLMVAPSGSSSLANYSGLVMSVSSALLGVFWAIQNMRHQKKQEAEKEKARFDSYSQYLLEKTEEVRQQYERTSRSLYEMYPEAGICLSYDENQGILWNRNTSHRDYLKHRLGTGNVPFQISIQAPVQTFSVYKDELADKPGFIKENYETLYDVPVVLDLAEHRLTGIVGGPGKAGAIEVAKLLTAQIAANNCYTDVKLGYIYNGETSNEKAEWEFARWLPHVWSEDKKTRYCAASPEQAGDVFYELTRIFRNRMEEARQLSGDKDTLPKPYYILFISDMRLLEGELITRYIFGKDQTAGLTTFILAERYEDLPNACDFIIENTFRFQGMYDVLAGEGQGQKISFDQADSFRLEKFARHLSTLQVQEMEKGGEIPNSLTFFEMMGVSGPEELPVRELWAKNRTYDNIRGMAGARAGGVPCYLDVHEKYHGPHGLVAGTTGSGKSETLQTYMLSLAVNYSPDDIGFFIIDYKGGGMANLFDGLPHMVGSISNLSGNQVKRAMISIKSENRRRQRVFTEHGVNNINLYTRLYKNGEATLPVPHLFIIIDEFAELKREEPDFMRELISVAQVGRSLGVHMILATQKPSGTVDDNIWSNSKFRLCLRVQDKQDSNDMLHKPDAAYITQAGRCYLQVGNDEVYELFQSGYSGAAYEENVTTGNTDIARMLELNGTVGMTGNSVRLSQKKKTEYLWLEQLADCLELAQKAARTTLSDCKTSQQFTRLVQAMYKAMWFQKLDYPVSRYNTDRLCDFLNQYRRLWAAKGRREAVLEELMEQSVSGKVKLPQKKEKTQLDAVKEYLAQMAQECGYRYHMQLWMPVLPDHIYLAQSAEFTSHCFKDGQWPEPAGPWSLEIVLGKMDDPENQNQMPLLTDFARTGHLAVVGSIVSGKSTLMQTVAFALINRYAPDMVNIYCIDFSSKMMSAFEEAPHTGGVMYETDLDKIGKFFNMAESILQERKLLMRGGNYSQYVQMNGVTMPAIVIFVDNYASFKEKTDERYEDIMITLSKEGVSQGIFLVVSGGGTGMNDITTRLIENISTTLCLQLQERFEYIDLLHTSQIEVMPEGGIKGRGLADYDGRILEFQTALSMEAENDYQRMELIAETCRQMRSAWTGKAARPVPEIPKKPVWSRFHVLEDYQKMRVRKERLPVAYDADSARVYGIDLRRIYCYMAYGTARSGKTNFLKVCIQAAMEKEGVVCVIDSDAGDLKSYQTGNVRYMDSEESVYSFFSELLPVFKERNRLKHELEAKDCEEEEIYEVMAEQEPYFIFIADMKWFVRFVTESQYQMKGFLVNILTKGSLHNIYFFSTVSVKDHQEVFGDELYEAFTGHKTGVHFGGNTAENRVLDFEYIPYSGQTKAMAPGTGCLPGVLSDADTSKIVVPLARR